MGHSKDIGNFRQRKIGILELERRGPARDQQLRYLSQRGDQFVDNAVGKISLIIFAVQGSERQYRQPRSAALPASHDDA